MKLGPRNPEYRLVKTVVEDINEAYDEHERRYHEEHDDIFSRFFNWLLGW